MRPEWHELFICEKCRYKMTYIDALSLEPRKDVFTGTREQAAREGWRFYGKYCFCPECVSTGEILEFIRMMRMMDD